VPCCMKCTYRNSWHRSRNVTSFCATHFLRLALIFISVPLNHDGNYLRCESLRTESVILSLCVGKILNKLEIVLRFRCANILRGWNICSIMNFSCFLDGKDIKRTIYMLITWENFGIKLFCLLVWENFLSGDVLIRFLCFFYGVTWI
jgi:hypothetical protein